MLKKDNPILRTTQNQPGTQPTKTDMTNQNHRQPKRPPKTLKPISATGQNHPELMPAEKVLPNENDENLKTCLLKKYEIKMLI